MKYKINIHAHSMFSDGRNSPYVMALKAKDLGFSALVITDHFYGRKIPEFMSVGNMRLLKKACNEAKKILPVIVGLEVPFMREEVLIFGGAAIQSVLENGKPDAIEMARLKKETGCAVVLCHPGECEHWEELAPLLDGFEEINSGQNCFNNGHGLSRGYGALENLPRWCNSDAHSNEMLDWNYNIVGSKIENESDLIKYIKRGSQPEFYINDRLA